jgi:flagellar protein FlbD
MIKLTRLSREPLVLNSELIEYMEAIPDTVITLTTGQKLRVNESPDEVIDRVIEFRKAILEGSCSASKLAGRGPERRMTQD